MLCSGQFWEGTLQPPIGVGKGALTESSRPGVPEWGTPNGGMCDWMSDRTQLKNRRRNRVAIPQTRGILAGVYTQTATHTTLLARLSQGSDGAAWAEFHERYGELIRRFARSRSMQSSDCDDILQEVLLSLSKTMPTFQYDPTRGKFRS